MESGAERMKSIFFAALERPAGEREAFIQGECGGDGALVERVRGLIRSHERAGGFMGAPTAGGAAALMSEAPDSPGSPSWPTPGTLLDRYRILEQIGEGGFGTVYLAEQEQPVRRRVAVKIIKPGMDTREVISRFQTERQALAVMDHPGIARVYDAGETDAPGSGGARPYFVMEHVAGEPLTAFCDRNRLGLRARLELFIQVCHAVQHAHHKGVIHRDLKPVNVLAGFVDGRPAAKVIDFGIAKAVRSRLDAGTEVTAARQIIGTPEYMSPEQATMGSADLDTRSDVYSLGAMLYELLTGAPPFERERLRRLSLGELERTIREEEPRRPSTRVVGLSGEEQAAAAEARCTDPAGLRAELRGDLDWIIMRALEKHRSRRYQTAAALAEDLERHLSDQPVSAGPPSGVYRIGKFVRRHRTLVGAAAVVAGVLVLGIAGTTAGLIWALRERTNAEWETFRVRQAETVARQRSADLETVLEYQQSVLGGLDPYTAGEMMLRSLRNEARTALADRGMEGAEIERALGAMDETLRGVDAAGLALSVLDLNVLRRAAGAAEREFADRPLVRAALQQALADTYRRLGLLERAAPMQEAALRIRQAELGGEHADTLASLAGAGQLAMETGEFAAAEEYLRLAYEGRARTEGQLITATLGAREDLGRALIERGKLEEAETHLRAVLEGKTIVLGDDHPSIALTLSSLGQLLSRRAEFVEAEGMLRGALERCRRHYGDRHEETTTAMGNLGQLLQNQGRLEEAEPYLREALEARRASVGRMHPGTLTAMNNLAGLLRLQGRLEPALGLFEEVLAMRRRTIGERHPDTLVALNNVAGTLQSLERFEEAEGRYREAYEGLRRRKGEGAPETLITAGNLAGVLTKLGRAAEAEPLARDVVARGREVFGAEHWIFGNALGKLGLTLTELGKFREAETSLLEAYRVLAASLGPAHEQSLRHAGHLAALYEAWHAAEPAAGHGEQASGWRKKSAPAG